MDKFSWMRIYGEITKLVVLDFTQAKTYVLVFKILLKPRW
jgi:hypothetical protein